MIQGSLAEVKIRGRFRWWFSTSPIGGFRPDRRKARIYFRLRNGLQGNFSQTRLGLDFTRLHLFTDPRSSVFIRGKFLLLVFPISVISVDQW